MQITEITEFDAALVATVQQLLPQLSASAPPPSAELIRQIVTSPASHLLIARDGPTVLGMLTLVVFPIPSGIRAWIEDVVVDTQGRGKGVGQALNEAALAIAEAAGARTVDLTSRPSREAANRLYQRIGFEPRQTNIYRLALPHERD